MTFAQNGSKSCLSKGIGHVHTERNLVGQCLGLKTQHTKYYLNKEITNAGDLWYATPPVIPRGLSTLYRVSLVIKPISQQISWEIQGLLKPSAIMGQPCRSNRNTHKLPFAGLEPMGSI